MPTIWLSTLGNNANDGSTYALAKATLNGATGALSAVSQGDTINVVNDGDHACVTYGGTTACQLAGTDWTTDPGLTIQGTDSAGNPALATVKADTTNTHWLRTWAGLSGGGGQYITVQGIKFDFTACYNASVADMRPLYFHGNIGSHRIYDCEFWYTPTVGSGVTITNTNHFTPLYFSGASVALSSVHTFEMTGCLMVNATRCDLQSINYLHFDIHHNVWIRDAQGIPSSSVVFVWPNEGAMTDYERAIYNNTFYQVRYGSEKTDQEIITSGIGDTPYLVQHSNLFYEECGSLVVVNGSNGVVQQGNTSASTTGTGPFGYNTIALGPYLDAFYSGWSSSSPGLTSYQFNENYRAGLSWAASEVNAGTNLYHAAALSDIFSDVASTYAWTPSGSSYSHTVPMDLRPIVDPYTAYDGGITGALPSAVTVPDSGETGVVDPGALLDSLPFYRPVMSCNLEAMVRIDRNGNIGHVDDRHYIVDRIYDEDVGRVFIVPAGETWSVNLSGVNKASLFMVEADTSVVLTVTTETESMELTLNEMLVVDGADVMSFDIQNSGSTDAEIQFLAIQ